MKPGAGDDDVGGEPRGLNGGGFSPSVVADHPQTRVAVQEMFYEALKRLGLYGNQDAAVGRNGASGSRLDAHIRFHG
jgi:hypothetical protein